MLVEVDKVSQVGGDEKRRLFSDEYFSLFVWYRGGRLYGFQLCYDRLGSERALTWTSDHGYSHQAIDAGEEPGLGMKQTPVLSPKSPPPPASLVAAFDAASTTLEAEIRDLVRKKLKDYIVTSR
jgi:hypothetical protein